VKKSILAVAVCIFFLGVTYFAFAADQKPPDFVIVKGAPMGGVKLNHKAHAALTKCDTCHHAAKAEKSSKVAQEKCSNCHTKVAAAPMKTKMQAAFHDPMAKKGICADCHTKNATKKVPTKCGDCHKKENV